MTVPDDRPGAPPSTIHGLFAWQAAVRGDAVAVADGTSWLSYRELDRRANQIAHHLRELGVGVETPVAVLMRRTPALVTALLGVLKAGGVYLPLDPSGPDERLALTLADAGAAVLLTDTTGRDLGERTVVDVAGAEVGGHPGTAPTGPGAGPGNLAYVIHTSGSTGRPKGVMVEHQAVTALLANTREYFRFGPGDVWPLLASAAFDMSVWEMWGALLHGGRLVVVPDDVRRSPDDLRALLAREQVTVLTATPAGFRQLIRADEDASPVELALRFVVLGGERLPLESLRPWFARHGDQHPEVVNMYGITETTVHTTCRRITAADVNAVPGSVIGEPIPGWSTAVLDPSGRPVPEGVAGEMYVGGAGVARGYLGRPGRTAERFVPDPDRPGARRYRSGDEVRRLPGGDHVYLGRLDGQVQIRGHRTELGEVETALATHPGVAEAAVLLDEENEAEARLIAYCVPRGDWPGTSSLREHLARLLPDYMLPNAFLELPALPLTGNGKVDRRVLAGLAGDPVRDVPYTAPQTPLQQTLADIWSAALNTGPVGLDDDFFELGGHSTLAVQIVAATRERLRVRVTLRLLFDQPTVREFAAAVGDLVTPGSRT